MENQGIHIIGDLYGCKLKNISPNKDKLKRLEKNINNYIKSIGLTSLSTCSYFFDQNAITLAICLAESHATIHTWPENEYTSIDVFVCNINNNNSSAAKKLFNYLANDICKAKQVKKHIIKRNTFSP